LWSSSICCRGSWTSSNASGDQVWGLHCGRHESHLHFDGGQFNHRLNCDYDVCHDDDGHGHVCHDDGGDDGDVDLHAFHFNILLC